MQLRGRIYIRGRGKTVIYPGKGLWCDHGSAEGEYVSEARRAVEWNARTGYSWMQCTALCRDVRVDVTAVPAALGKFRAEKPGIKAPNSTDWSLAVASNRE